MLSYRFQLNRLPVAKFGGRLIRTTINDRTRLASTFLGGKQLVSDPLSPPNFLLNNKPNLTDFRSQLHLWELKDKSDENSIEKQPESNEVDDKSNPKPTTEEKPPPESKKRTPKIQKVSIESSGTIKRTSSSTGNDGGDGNNGKKDDGNGGESNPPERAESPEVYPQVLALPMSNRPLFPGFYRPVAITDPQVIKAIHELSDKSKPYIGIFMFKDDQANSDVIMSKDEIHEVGVFAQITSSFVSKDEATGKETMTIITYPHGRIKIDDIIPPKSEEEIQSEQTEKIEELETEVEEELLEEGKDLSLENVKDEKNVRVLKRIDEENQYNPVDFLKKYRVARANITKLENEPFDKKSQVINALTSEILKVFKEVSQINSMFREQIATFSAAIQSSHNVFEDPATLADFCAAVCAGESQELQDVLDALNIEDRLKNALIVLKKEVMTAKLQDKISKDVESKIQKRQREYYLMEQLKGIKKELGIDDGRQKLIDTFNERANELKMPPYARKVFDEEIAKLQTLETAMSEFGVTRTYLDWLTKLPWGKYTQESFNIPNARKVLNEDHYGLKDIKDRILEFIAVGSLLGAVDGKIICFVGPPGVGKTSIGKSIARALNRNFFRFSVGGIADVSEIKGHRRTYVGALPGRIIQGLKKTQSSNPLILIDEIDKITHGGSQGDPSAALLELLDPEQNSEFLDQYLDIPVDLSKVLFVCTANTLETIPGPLLDRMEIIELPGYLSEEKIKIAENYLVPVAKKTSGLEDAKVNITTEAIETIVKHYSKENGVRKLKQYIEKIYRKAAFKVVTEVAVPSNSQSTVEQNEESEKDSVKVPKETSSEVTTEVEPESEGESGSEAVTPKSETASGEWAKDSEEKIVPNLEHDKPLETKETINEDEVDIRKLCVPETYELEITSKDVPDYVGPYVFNSERIYETTPPGVVMGLAWSPSGGSSLYVESTAEESISETGHPTGGKLKATGRLGDVMKESTTIALSVAKQYVKSDFFKTHNINLHCPEGAVSKDGPSAGITITTCLISLALNHPLPNVSMTGEITLTGKVLKIGGLKEKLIAAKRNGVTELYLSKDNKGDFDALTDDIKEGFDVTFADNYKEIYEKLFKDVPNEPSPKFEPKKD